MRGMLVYLVCNIIICLLIFQCGRNPQVLQNTYYMQEHAVSLNGFSAPFLTELGHELMLQGKLKDSVKCYRNAMKLDETSVDALTGKEKAGLLITARDLIFQIVAISL